MTDSSDVDDLAGALYGSIGLLARRLRQLQAPGELTLPERAALSRLDRGGPTTAAELARAEQITSQAMGTTLGGLEERGLVERRRDPHDGRRIIMSVTEAGVEVLRHKRDARSRQVAQALRERFTEAELATLKAAAPLIERLGDSF
ncbi:MarR family winged helix-turn-helix transcriptional regulator [Streptomyces sp. NPDC057743]|uniref:MarR family winged helix-turn-helix transcriptional regulator n=1 Tax=Streptomyces sp. NPDC057743 TaxID=3346236 RepID=UPI0036BC25E7